MDAKKANLNKDFKDRISPKSQFVKKRIPNVKKIIAISSAKGGVGKSTIAANIAVELGKNFNVGLLDADIYGPSIPQLFGVKEKPTTDDGKRLNPIIKFNVYLMSIGFLVDKKSPMVWRGPMVISAIKTFVNNVNWSSLDYLIIDMPPGTGDALITFSQELEIDGAIIVTTPQKLSVNDAMRGIEMFKKTNVPILGVIENMSYLIDKNNSKKFIFSKGGGEMIAKNQNIKLLGQIPIHESISASSDNEVPLMHSMNEDIITNEIKNIYGKTSCKKLVAAKYFSGSLLIVLAYCLVPSGNSIRVDT